MQLAKNLETLPILLRRYDEANDKNYIISSWIKSDRHNGANRNIPSAIYFPEKQIIIKDLIARSQIMIAHLDDTPDMIVAYVVYQYLQNALVIHYAFTGESFGGQGVQSKLLMEINMLAQPLAITTMPNIPLFLHLKKNYSCIYNPFLVRQ